MNHEFNGLSSPTGLDDAIEFLWIFFTLSHVLRDSGAGARPGWLGSRQVRATVLVEFAGIGMLAGLVAAIGASLLAWIISDRLLHIPYAFNPWLAMMSVGAGLVMVPAAAWLGVRRIVHVSPRQVLQSV